MSGYFDENVVKNGLDDLPKWKRAAFGALLLSRAIPNYLMFQVETGVSGGPVLTAALSRIWAWLESENADWLAAVSAEVCQSLAPDTELYDAIHTSSALDAVSVAANVLEFIDSGDVELIVECASLLHDSTYLYVGNKEELRQDDIAFDAKVRNHPIVKNEVQFQLDDIGFLATLPSEQAIGWRSVLERSLNHNYGALALRE